MRATPNFALQVIASLLTAAFLLTAQSALAAFEKEEAEVEALVQDGKYLSAASLISGRPELMSEPRFVRYLTHILTTKYVFSVGFGVFSLKDLEKGQRIEDYRGQPGQSQIVTAGLDELLYERIKKNPNSPDLNYAMGEYLSRGIACGCRAPGPIKDLSGDDAEYFLKAYRGGVSDGWSLFRIGMHHQAHGRLDDAIAFYKKSLIHDPKHTATTYNLATTHYMKGDFRFARTYVEQALGKYDNAELNADTYAMHGMILMELGDDQAAERSLDEALKLKTWHAQAFTALLTIYRRTKQDQKYVKRAQDFIALDYGNTYTFNAYVDFLYRSGQIELDRRIEQNLLTLKLNDPQQNGALYFNLARMADFRGDKTEAVSRYQRSLAALKALKNPPEGAIPGITQRIGQLTGAGGK